MKRRQGREPAPVPPLADAAVSRIERGVFAALDRDAAVQGAGAGSREGWLVTHRGRWAVVAGAAALAAVATWGMRTWWRAPGLLLAHGARIATATSPSHLTVEGAAIDVAPASAVTFAPGDNERDGATVIRLERGSVTCEVAPRAGRAPFVVEAGTTRVTVVGTRFAVTRVGDRAQVSVVHGTVQVDDDGVTRLVHAGERYLPTADTPAVAQEETPELATAPETMLTSSRAADESPLNSARARVFPVPSPVRGGGLGRGETLRAVALAHVGSRKACPLPNPLPQTGEGTGTVCARAESGGDLPVTARAPEAAPAVVTGAALHERFDSAAALEVRDPLAAFRIYRELANGSGPWAANALFAEARLSAERGQRDAANALLSSYLERFPDGPNADDARALLARLKGSSGALR